MTLDGVADGSVIGLWRRIGPRFFALTARLEFRPARLPSLRSLSGTASAVLQSVEVPRLGTSFALLCEHSFATDSENLRVFA
ncbi:hypothetical protein GGD61_000242 [Bradyrhizobium sp. SBR1B]|nr:hypothetical protein [Bradyrhizobium sp. SBR1B]